MRRITIMFGYAVDFFFFTILLQFPWMDAHFFSRSWFLKFYWKFFFRKENLKLLSSFVYIIYKAVRWMRKIFQVSNVYKGWFSVTCLIIEYLRSVTLVSQWNSSYFWFDQLFKISDIFKIELLSYGNGQIQDVSVLRNCMM